MKELYAPIVGNIKIYFSEKKNRITTALAT